MAHPDPAASTESLKTRALRSSGSLLFGFGGQNMLRLASNLILTRLLFPEAFGLMALVQVFIVGLTTFSDIGITTSVITSSRGDERNYLNTAWTLQIIRGFGLWLLACAISYPLAHFYEEPDLVPLLQVVGFSMVIRGFFSTKGMTAGRHLAYGRVTIIEIASQAVGTVCMIVLAYIYQSIWALAIGTLLGGLSHTIMSHVFLPGQRNRLHWNTDDFWEIFHFGKYLFLNTIAGFFVKQGDRAVLGAYISLGLLGIYNIGMFLGSAPLLLGQRLFSSLLVPLYRMRPPAESEQNRRNMRRARRMLIGCLLAMIAPLMFGGLWLVEALYDPRYVQAGAIVVLYAISTGPMIISEDYGNVLLANRDSKNLLLVTLLSAVIQMGTLIVGINMLGIVGAVLAPGVTAIVTYPLRAYFANRFNAWDPIADFVFFVVFVGLSATALAFNQDMFIGILST
ncbi:oligosaccharide flippase family protein [Yoonia sp. R2331]|uniref:oligosaccharide flippase family protein n=1 Tax=Yoonia sp. R2331 TaxID=3237238 RepID=UPI0034E50C4A